MNKSEGDLLTSAAGMFNWVEYSVFGSMLVFSLLIGVYYGWFKKQDTVAEYLLGGKKMGVYPVTMSLVFSHTSGVTLLGIPAEIYSYGTQYFAISLTVISVFLLINYCYLPVFYELQLNSVYEYLELRFSKKIRSLASFIFAISLILFTPLVIYVPALAFNQVTGVSVHIIAPIVSFICIFYTSFGGLKAVVWTDALQSLFTIGSVFFIITLGFLKFGSISEVFRINDEGKRLELFNMSLSPFERATFWSMGVGSITSWLSQLAVHPGAVQRFISVPTFKEAKQVMFWSAMGFFLIKVLVISVGLLMYATYHDCDPVAAKIVGKTGQLLPHYVMEVAKDYPGITGLFISGVLSAALSTMSASLNTAAGTIYEDFVKFVLRGKEQSEAQQSFTLKIITLILGLICTSLVFVVERLGELFKIAMSMIGVTNGALIGLFTLGIFCPRANAKGALAGATTSMAAMVSIVFGAQYYIAQGMVSYRGKITSVSGCPANFTAHLGYNASAFVETYTGVGAPVVADESVPLIFQMSFICYSLVGTLIVFMVGLPVSYLTEHPPPKSLDPHLFAPCVRRFLPETQKKTAANEYKLVLTESSPSDDNVTNSIKRA